MITTSSERSVRSLLDYFFWLLLILYTNPGGLYQALNIFHISGRYTFNDLVFVLLSILFVIIPKKYDLLDIEYRRIRLYMMGFIVYYFIVFVFIVPSLNGNKEYSLMLSLIKSRWAIYSVFLFVYVYVFFKRSPEIFLNIFSYSSIAVLLLFFVQIMINADILPLNTGNRGFVDINRLILKSEGLMNLLIPIGIVVFITKSKTRYNNVMLTGFILMALYYIATLFRRYLVAIIIIMLLTIIIKSYITGKYRLLYKSSIKALTLIIIVVVSTYIIIPKYVKATGIALYETVNVLAFGKTSTGLKDERLELDRSFIVEQFSMHPLFGTGFDDRWRTKYGDNQGYEAADYPFLAALAMFGISGIIIFLPVYLRLIFLLKKDLKFLKKTTISFNDLEFVLLFTFILFFLNHLLQYINYYSPLSTINDYLWYISLSFYLASRHNYYLLFQNKRSLSNGN